jgi:hypothetical protein
MQMLQVIPIDKGLKTDREAFNIDNDSFPTLVNAYQWRGRIKRKRGTAFLCRLQRFFNSAITSYGSIVSVTLDGTGSANFLTGFALQTNGSIVPGTVTFTDSNTGDVYTDPAMNGTLLGTPAGSGTINYATGIINIGVGNAGHIITTVSFVYNPALPVMGLEFFFPNPTVNPGTVGFDTTYAYNISSMFPYAANDVSFYWNPATGLYPGYVAKPTPTQTSWNGQNYQQFWTTNYQGAMWATNGINIPFTITNIGMQYAPTNTITYVSNTTGPPATLTLTITNCPLVIGDFVFANEFTGGTGLNFQTGYVTASAPNTPPLATKTITITFPNATLSAGPFAPGIIQYVTNRSSTTIDCIRWYDGSPTNNSLTNPVFNNVSGWVNFQPPLSQGPYSIADLPPAIYYLVGARMIFPFKDRLLFIGPVVQTSAAGSQVYLQDTVIYSQNGTPYYTASYTNTPNAAIDTPTSITNIFNPLLVPPNETATSPAWFEDQTGFGGFVSAGVNDSIISVSPNEDVLIMGFTKFQTRFIFTGNILPFEFFIVNSELGTSSTFSFINMDQGIISRGSRGYIITSQVGAQRVDLDIPDEVFEINLLNNGTERFTAQRDFINEWIYFTYNSGNSDPTSYIFPNQTLQFNYRDNSYALFNESYTTYGSFTAQTGITWATLPPSLTWNSWNTPWNSGNSTLLQPTVIAGNQEGFVLFRDEDLAGTNESVSLYITSYTDNTFTVFNHGLNENDYIVISGMLGTIGALLNGNIFSVFMITQNTFMLNPSVVTAGTTYFGGGLITRMYVPFIQTKQFPVAWGIGRKVRMGMQQYLLTTTNLGQIILQIYLSQNSDTPYNMGPIVPAAQSTNNSLIYSDILFTSPELYTQVCNNIPLGTIGNGVFLTFMFNYFTEFFVVGNLVPGSVFISVGNVATFQDNGTGGFTATGTGTSVGSLVMYNQGIIVIAFTVAPTDDIATTNFNYYVSNLQNPTAASQNQIWHRINTSLIGDTVQLGFTMSDTQMRDSTFPNQFAEIELHGFQMEVEPSGYLA